MIDWIYPAILIGAGLVLASILTSAIAFRYGAPLLLVFLGIGLLAGEDGLGIRFDDAETAYFVGSLALAAILFDSGFCTRMRTFRPVAAPAITLATLGVAFTAGLVGVFAHYLLGLPWLEALLIGAIVGSTDAAAVFFLLRVGGIAIREQVRSTLEVESGSNDPMAIFLTVILVELILAGGSAGDMSRQFAIAFAAQMGLGIALGLAGGFLLIATAKRVTLEGALYPIGILSAAICLFSLTGLIGGSGFLAVYVAGLVAGNGGMTGSPGLRRFMEGTTWLAQIAMFLTLGLLATPSTFLDVALPAIGIALALTFLCRPLAIWVCLLPFGYRRRETAFISWVGLRGAVTILLGIIPLVAGLENGQLLLNTAYIIVLTSLLLQGWTIRPTARWLGLIVPPRIGPVSRLGLDLPGSASHELILYRVVAGSPVVEGERLPRWARPSLVVRDGRSLRYQYAGRLQEGDLVYMFIPPQYTRLLDRLFASPARLSANDSDFYGEFTVDPKQSVAALVEAYGISITPDANGQVPIGDLMLSRLGGTAEVGDRVSLNGIEMIVREIGTNGSISEVGLTVDHDESRLHLPLFMSGREMIAWLRKRLRWRSGRGQDR